MKLSELQPLEINDRLRQLINTELDRAQLVWKDVGPKMVIKADMQAITEQRRLKTDIPGYPSIDPSKPAVDEFIAFVVDMRDSTGHLTQAISHRHAQASQTERVLYETSALLPAAAEVVRWQKGKVTEYLGDGVLALFRASEDQDEACYAACRAARKVIGDMRDIVNEALYARFRLPEINLGVGMAFSKAVVTIVGHPEEPAPKAIGTCVYRASKLASLVNEIAVDDNLEAIWPEDRTGGGFHFQSRTIKDISGYVIPATSE